MPTEERLECCGHNQGMLVASGFFPKASGESRALSTPQFWSSENDFRFLASRIIRQCISVV